jgi:hypothetical protein
MKTDLDQITREIALHESSHAYFGWRAGHIIQHIVMDDPGNFDHPNHCREITLPGVGRRWLNRDDVHYILGGAAISTALDLDDPFAGCEGDLKILEDLMTSPDDETAAMREFIVHHPDVTAREFAEHFMDGITARLKNPKVMKCIESGAELLMNSSGRVPGFLMVQLFEFIWGDPLPEGVAPLWMHGRPDKEDPVTPAAALDRLGDAITKLEQAVDDCRCAFDYENPEAEKLGARTLQFSFQARDLFQRIEIKLPARKDRYNGTDHPMVDTE